MGKKKRKESHDKSETMQTSDNNPKYSANDLLQKASECMDSFQFDLAIKFCERAIECEPENVGALETAGYLYAELGHCDRAKEVLLTAVEKSPVSGYEKFMYLGQLSEGKESVDFYLRGIDVIQATLESSEGIAEASINKDLNNQPDIKKLKRDESNAYCSIAEIYLTDFCFEDTAEEKCKQFCDAALLSDPSNPDAYFAMASFLLSKNDVETAREMACKSIEIWAPPATEDEKETLLEKESDTKNTGNENLKPSYESRLNISKVLIEVKEYSKALFVLGTLMEENDEDFQLLYLLGLANNMQGDILTSNAYLEQAKELSDKIGCDDDELLVEIDNLLTVNKEAAATTDDSKNLNVENEDITMETE